MAESIFQPSSEHQFLRETVRAFTRKEVESQASKFDREERFNIELFRKLGDLGCLGVTVPTEFGGAGLDAVAAVIIHEELSYSDPGFALAYLAHSMLCVNNLAVNGSDVQRQSILPDLISGQAVGAMGLSEPDAGTDVQAMRTQAKKVKGGYSITGCKMWITNGTVDESSTPCDVLLLYAKTDPTNISTFIVKKGDPGFSVGQKIRDKLGMRGSNTAELCFDECFVPEDRLVGKEGEALIHMMRNLEIERLTLAAMSLGIARRSFEIMLNYSKDRKAFGQLINRFGQIQAFIGDSFAKLQAARSYVYSTANELNLNKPGNRLDSDGVKLFAARAAKEIADCCIQTLGGYGYVGEYVVERLWRDSKLLEIGGGTNEAHQKNITKDLSKFDLSNFW